ncbi:MAG TPA: 4-alpha-glucanotransferase [Pirellulales bacterium]|nr:4-alpha-glucanotransferase [Pirellulales bacterium]
MAAKVWGIDEGYEDAEGNWQEVAPEVKAAVCNAMGGDGPGVAGREVQVLDQGKSPCLPVGRLTLEDGTLLRVGQDGQWPPDLPIGYHDFYPRDEMRPAVRIIVTPGRCVLPPDGLWGWSAQLYATRSNESWGLGDLADLRRLCRWAASRGAGLVLVNPLSASAPVTPQQPSPYYPSSRRFLNPIYLRVEEVPGAADFVDDLAGLAKAGRALNEDRQINRDAVYRLKTEALESIWRHSSPGEEFERFCAQRGSSLDEFATHCALAEEFGGDWRLWPDEYRRVDGQAVRSFVEARGDRVGYHRWLQWLLDEQLRRAAAEGTTIVQDLAIGVDPGGADAWSWQHLYAGGCSVGAPPDLYNRRGQDWGLPPFIPHKLRGAGYEPLRQTLRAVLRHAGGVRIDHVMGLFRLYWIPEGFDPSRGAFVRYRGDEMLAIVAIESQRAGAFVVGEDLGTVEPEIRARLAAHGVLSYRLLWFEEEPPSKYPPMSMAAVTTHDLPTVAGLWSGQDLAAQRRLGLKPNEEGTAEIQRRVANLAHLDARAPIDQVIEQVYRLLSEAASRVALASLDDALAITERPNMPCTTEERPNWSLAIPGGLEQLENSRLAGRIACAMNKGRSGRGTG